MVRAGRQVEMAAVVEDELSGGFCGSCDRAGAAGSSKAIRSMRAVRRGSSRARSGAGRGVDALAAVRGDVHAHTSAGTQGPTPQR
ncbi:hypothetical protein AVL59_13510 [Streptomyces griseochromogenes]|uniref:Uncharacterized protein n=1 Tax=Streptomyces griseochromogenes TaxID=68214 RepID=A0A1B1AVD4_9ACTN|nr:hypothetical protein AVL59_13510 [Streptomyces griseochromogenes]